MNLPTTNSTHYFILKDGVIKWIKEMPEEPSTPIDYYYHNLHTAGGEDVKEEWEKYQTALQSAIDNAIEVSNQEEVRDFLLLGQDRSKHEIERLKSHFIENNPGIEDQGKIDIYFKADQYYATS